MSQTDNQWYVSASFFLLCFLSSFDSELFSTSYKTYNCAIIVFLSTIIYVIFWTWFAPVLSWNRYKSLYLCTSLNMIFQKPIPITTFHSNRYTEIDFWCTCMTTYDMYWVCKVYEKIKYCLIDIMAHTWQRQILKVVKSIPAQDGCLIISRLEFNRLATGFYQLLWVAED